MPSARFFGECWSSLALHQRAGSSSGSHQTGTPIVAAGPVSWVPVAPVFSTRTEEGTQFAYYVAPLAIGSTEVIGYPMPRTGSSLLTTGGA